MVEVGQPLGDGGDEFSTAGQFRGKLVFSDPVLAENLIRPIGTLFGVVDCPGILPMGRRME